jgi:hypothetical protein
MHANSKMLTALPDLPRKGEGNNHLSFPYILLYPPVKNKAVMTHNSSGYCTFFLGGGNMGRNSIHHNRDKNKQKLPQVPKNLKRDGLDIEFSEELSDHEDIEAQARSKAADQRARIREHKE